MCSLGTHFAVQIPIVLSETWLMVQVIFFTCHIYKCSCKPLHFFKFFYITVCGKTGLNEISFPLAALSIDNRIIHSVNSSGLKAEVLLIF